MPETIHVALNALAALPPALLITLGAIFGLLVGSFLNVVIYRLPLRMQADWRRESLDFLGLEPEAGARKFGLVFPASHCPGCNAPIKPWHNIPVISYLLLKGRCSRCATPISVQYPLVELTSGVLSALILYWYGATGTTLLVLLFTWILVALTGIDFRHQLLPDNLTLPLLWLGLLVNMSGVFTDLASAVLGAVTGYLSLWSIYWLFKLVTGREGMGHGDFKLLAALGAWLGWQQLPLIILLSSLVGAIVGLLGIALRGRDRQIPIAFGPYLAVAGWIALIGGAQLTNAYLELFQ